MPVSEQGINRNRYMILPRVLIFIFRGRSVLLIKGAPEKRLWAGKYNGLGGHVELGEDVLTAARRELRRKSGLEVELKPTGIVFLDSGKNPGVGIFIYVGKYERGELKPSAEGVLEWVSLSDVGKIPVVEDLPLLLDRIQKMRPGEAPFSAHSFYDSLGTLQLEFSN